MTPIYIKLGPGVNSYVNERLGIALVDPIITAAVFDYSNLNDEVSSALNSNTIVQIDQGEYYNIPKSNDVPTVTPGYLLTLYKYTQGCPMPGDDLFIQRGTSFLKINWKKFTECLGINTKFRFIAEIGDDPVSVTGEHAYTLPGAGGTIFQHLDLKGKSDVRVEVSGTPIYNIPADDRDYYVFDPVNGTIARPGGFNKGDIFAVYEL